MTIAKVALQIILGLIFLFTGSIKLFTPKEKLATRGVTGFENIAPHWIKCLGIAEITGAFILLASGTNVLRPLLSQIAAFGFALLTIAASYHHFRRKEYRNMTVTGTLFVTSLFLYFLR